MKFLKVFFSAAHALLGILFVLVSVLITVLAVQTGWRAVGADTDASAEMAIEAIGLLAIAVVSLQIAQTITEEEVVRDAHISITNR